MDGQHHPLLRLCVGSQSSIHALKSLLSFVWYSQTEISTCQCALHVERISLTAVQLGVAIAITECCKDKQNWVPVLHKISHLNCSALKNRVFTLFIPLSPRNLVYRNRWPKIGPSDFGTAWDLWYLTDTTSIYAWNISQVRFCKWYADFHSCALFFFR